MSSLITLVLVKAAVASLIALGAAVATRFAKRPTLVHGLWLLVLLELLVPPVLEISVIPRDFVPEWTRSSAVTGAGRPSPVAPPVPSTAPETPVDTQPFNGRSGAGGVERAIGLWLAGALALGGLSLIRALRFRRGLAGTQATPAGTLRMLDELVAGMKLRRAPELRIVKRRISPLVWPRLRGSLLVLPAGLLPRLRREEQRALLAHELAHLKRGDPWVRWVELAASVLFWWLPSMWWARRELRRAEERCCDELVLQTLPRHAADYARGLVKTLTFLADRDAPLPALASGAGVARNMEERLLMILNPAPARRPSRLVRLALTLAGVCLLMVFPIQADGWSGDWSDDSSEPRRAESRGTLEGHPDLQGLAAQAGEFERLLEEMRAVQLEMQGRLRELRSRLEIEARQRGITLTESSRRIDERGGLEQQAREMAQGRLQREERLLASRHELYATERALAQLDREMAERATREKGSADLELRARKTELELSRLRRELDMERARVDRDRAHEETERATRDRLRALERMNELRGHAR